MQDAFVNICGVPTRVITCGRWIEESLDNVDELVICITGNPGLTGLYTKFLIALYERLERNIPVWVIGHAGHEEPPRSSIRCVPQLKGNEVLFDLDGQLQHKIEFIEKYVPAHVKVHLVGHSIGAWLLLQMLEQQHIKDKVKKCYLIFPAIERLIDSPNGWKFTKIALPIYIVFGFTLSLFSYIPKFIRLILVYVYFWFASIPFDVGETILNYLRMPVMEKVVFLAEDEMQRVRCLQHDLLEKNMPSLMFFYGTTDGWVPTNYYKRLRDKYPMAEAILDTEKIDHAFVLRFSEQMGQIVGDMVIKHSILARSN